MGNGDAQGCAGSAFGIVGNDIENFYLELLAQGTEDGADEKGSKQAEGHGSQGVNQIGLHRNVYIFPFQEFFHT